jgi:mRNA-degrading endonuclease toxin of MazEF toxin-antitoxin module
VHASFQVRSVSKARLIRQIGAISDKELQETLDALKLVFGMASYPAGRSERAS